MKKNSKIHGKIHHSSEERHDVAFFEKRRKSMTGILMTRYVVTLVISWIVPVAMLFIFVKFLQDHGYYSNLFKLPVIGGILMAIRNAFTLFLIVYFLLIFAVVTYSTLRKPLRYLDEVIEASESLSDENDGYIVLSDDLKSFEIDLNEIKRRNIKNAREAREAVRRKNDLLVYLAHDLKTPLTSVLGYLYLLNEEKEISPRLRERYTEIALRKSERLEDLINEFFEITRFNLTNLSLQMEKLSLTRMIEQMTFEFNPFMKEKNLKWQLNLSKDAEVTGDRDKLGRVFDNLFKNAVNYSYAESNIEITLKDFDTHCEVEIKNHGKTIPQDKLGRIFDQFYRMDSSRASSTGGSGLGLAISKDIVEHHGGTLKAYSKDEWVMFRIILPKIIPTTDDGIKNRP